MSYVRKDGKIRQYWACEGSEWKSRNMESWYHVHVTVSVSNSMIKGEKLVILGWRSKKEQRQIAKRETLKSFYCFSVRVEQLKGGPCNSFSVPSVLCFLPELLLIFLVVVP